MIRLFSILACIGIGGGFGALAREGTMSLMHGIIGLPAFVSLAFVNVFGSFLIGIIFGSLEGHLNRDGTSRLKQAPHHRHLHQLPWWPNGDLTQPAVDLLQARITLQTASAISITGFLGAYTTFSAFSLLTVQLLQSGQILNAIISVVGSVCLSLLMVWIGLHVGVRIAFRKSLTGE
tara:strand:- start:1694 stop:2224 length:531 start_codon:yes stop_codon:yes gene_type:complete